MKHKFEESVHHDHDVEFNAEDVKDVLDKAGEVAIQVLVVYFVGDSLRHIFKRNTQ